MKKDIQQLIDKYEEQVKNTKEVLEDKKSPINTNVMVAMYQSKYLLSEIILELKELQKNC